MSHGIHHITAISGNPQTNLDFYSGVLGLRFIKKTVNFDDPGTYHFYFGDNAGNPGTIMTFFPWGENAQKGRPGKGQVTVTSFSIPAGSLNFWQDRLKKYNVTFAGPYERFGEKILSFEDPDGIGIELIETNYGSNTQITGFHSATLSIDKITPTQNILTDVLGFKQSGYDGNRYRFASENFPGKFIDLLIVPDAIRGIMGAGAVHHIAFRAKDENRQLEMREAAIAKDMRATEVIDRKYFKSVYFREPNGILFEIATDPPGFFIDETNDELGKKLQLPEWYEYKRDAIEGQLQKLTEPRPERIFSR